MESQRVRAPAGAPRAALGAAGGGRFEVTSCPWPQAMESALAAGRKQPIRQCLAIPAYLQQAYWWAYVDPRAVNFFERDWLVNAILFGNYNRLRDAALAALGQPVTGRTLQVACAYGSLTPTLVSHLSPEAELEVMDVVPAQLANLAAKLKADERVHLVRGDASCITHGNGSFDQALLFFLLHEQPESVRRATLSEALRVVKPGGRVVIVDYHRPPVWHPLRPLVSLVFRLLEPFARDFCHQGVEAQLPRHTPPARVQKTTYFGGLYQMLVITR